MIQVLTVVVCDDEDVEGRGWSAPINREAAHHRGPGETTKCRPGRTRMASRARDSLAATVSALDKTVSWDASLAFLDTLRSGSSEAMDASFRRLVTTWIPSSSASVIIHRNGTRDSFISAPLPWSARLGSVLNAVWTDRTIRARLVTGGARSEEVIAIRGQLGSLEECLGRLALETTFRGEWRSSSSSAGLSWESLRYKLRHQQTILRGRLSTDNNDDSDAVYGWAMLGPHARLDDPTWRLLCYTPTTIRTRYWLQYAILLGLPVQWSEPYRSQVQWLLHALLPGFSHSILVDVWPWVVRCWMTGLADLVAPEPVPLQRLGFATEDQRLWDCHRLDLAEVETYIPQTLDWISKRLCDPRLLDDWTLTPCWFHPTVILALRQSQLYRPAPVRLTHPTEAVAYCLRVVMLVTTLGFLARQASTLKGTMPLAFRIWVGELRQRVWRHLEARLRDRWQREFARQRVETLLQTSSMKMDPSHVLVVL